MIRPLPVLCALAAVLTAAAAAAAPCAIVDLDGGRGWPPPLDEETVECRAAYAYGPHFERLQAAAGFAPRRWKLALQRDGSENAILAVRAGLLVVTTGFLRRHAEADDVVLYTLAHELGHGVQERTSPYAPDPSVPTDVQDRADRRREAHADSIARTLLIQAGYDPRTAARGVEGMFTCAAIAAGGAPVGDHPSPRTRWVNLLVLGQRAASGRDGLEPSAADFDDDGRLRGADRPSREAEEEAVRACGRLLGSTFSAAVAAGREPAP